MSIVFNIIQSSSQVNVTGDVVSITVANGVTFETINTIVDGKIDEALTKDNIPGLKITDSPEFVDIQTPALQSDAVTGGEIPATVYDWFKSVYSSLVDKAVKSWITGLVTFVKSLAERVDKLEDSYLLKYVVPVDSVGFDLTHDRYGRPFNFTDGDVIEIAFRVDAWVNNGSDANRLNCRINGISESVYNYSNSFFNYMLTSGSSVNSQYPIMILHLVGRELNYFIIDKYKNTSDVYGQNLYAGMTIGLNAEAITTINFFIFLNSSLIPAGTEIIIKKL